MKIHLAAFAALILIALLNIKVPTHYQKPTREARPAAVRQLTLSFSGDLIQHMPQLRAADNGDGTYDFSRTFAYIDTVWRSVDFAIINYETTVSANGKYTGFPCFSSPPDVAWALRKAGVDVAALANNHCCDKGRVGIEKTVSTLNSIGLLTTGITTDPAKADEILMLNKGTFRVALLNYTFDTNGIPIPKGGYVNLIDTVKMRHDIQRAKTDSAATHVVAFVHWGNEYQRKANNTQKQIAMWCRQNGIDAVVGSHPHVVQQIDTVNKIVYSLGNFISNQQDQYTDSGLTVVLKLEHRKPVEIEYVPHWCDKFPANRKEKYRVLPECDTVLQKGESLVKMKKALREARQAVGEANEYKL